MAKDSGTLGGGSFGSSSCCGVRSPRLEGLFSQGAVHPRQGGAPGASPSDSAMSPNPARLTGLGWRAVLQQRLARVRRRMLFIALEGLRHGDERHLMGIEALEQLRKVGWVRSPSG
jgi:hypothetical protein